MSKLSWKFYGHVLRKANVLKPDFGVKILAKSSSLENPRKISPRPLEDQPSSQSSWNQSDFLQLLFRLLAQKSIKGLTTELKSTRRPILLFIWCLLIFRLFNDQFDDDKIRHRKHSLDVIESILAGSPSNQLNWMRTEKVFSFHFWIEKNYLKARGRSTRFCFGFSRLLACTYLTNQKSWLARVIKRGVNESQTDLRHGQSGQLWRAWLLAVKSEKPAPSGKRNVVWSSKRLRDD